MMVVAVVAVVESRKILAGIMFICCFIFPRFEDGLAGVVMVVVLVEAVEKGRIVRD